MVADLTRTSERCKEAGERQVRVPRLATDPTGMMIIASAIGVKRMLVVRNVTLLAIAAPTNDIPVPFTAAFSASFLASNP
jgi:hypothetical protein